jgi:hypothetical protein
MQINILNTRIGNQPLHLLKLTIETFVIMKNVSNLLLFIILFFVHSVSAQNVESVFSKEFGSTVTDFDRFSYGHWLIAETHTPTPDLIFEDEMVVRIFDSSCNEIKQIPIIPIDTAAKNLIHKLLVLSDTSFLVEYGSGDCDAYPYRVFFEARDTNGQIIWTTELQTGSPSSKISLSADGQILRIAEGLIEKINSSTGEIIWTYFSSWNTYVNKIFFQNTQDVLLIDDGKIERYTQITSNTGEISYELTQINPLPAIFSGSTTELIASPNGGYYGYNIQKDKIIHIKSNFTYQVWSQSMDYSTKVVATDAGLVLIQDDNNKSFKLTLFDSTGLQINQFISKENWTIPSIVKYFSGHLGILGVNLSGRISSDLNSGREQGWFRDFTGFGIDNPQEVSVSINEVQQNEPLNHTSYFSPMAGTLHDFDGGDYRIKVTNTGQVPVQSFWVNTKFNYAVNLYICGPTPAKEVFYDNLNLLPGDSIWVDFGDIDVYNQYSYPTKICFWTSAPNHNPDNLSTDDLLCKTAIVPIKEVQNIGINITPNPADNFFEITQEIPFSSQNQWKLINNLGKLVLSGKTTAGTTTFVVPTESLPSGVYFFFNELKSSKIVVQH